MHLLTAPRCSCRWATMTPFGRQLTGRYRFVSYQTLPHSMRSIIIRSRLCYLCCRIPFYVYIFGVENSTKEFNIVMLSCYSFTSCQPIIISLCVIAGWCKLGLSCVLEWNRNMNCSCSRILPCFTIFKPHTPTPWYLKTGRWNCGPWTSIEIMASQWKMLESHGWKTDCQTFDSF